MARGEVVESLDLQCLAVVRQIAPGGSPPRRAPVLAFVVGLGLVFGRGSPASAQAPTSVVLSYPDRPRFTVQPFGEPFGLGVITVTSLAQDLRGYLWIGTQTGLFRYDGSRVKRFGEVDSLVGHFIEKLTVAPDGTVWVKGTEGLASFVRGRFVPFRLPAEAGAIAATAQSFAVNRRGTLFVSVAKGLLRAESGDGSRYRLFTTTQGVSDEVGGIAIAPDDGVWITSGNRLGHLARGSNHLVWDAATVLPAPHGRYISLTFDGAGALWLRTAQHLIRIDPLTHQQFFSDREIAPANPEGGLPTLDQRGHLLVPSGAGLFWQDDGGWRVIRDEEGLASNTIVAALEDREGTLWVGGSGTGLERVVGFREWTAWTKAHGLPDNSTWGTVRDKQGKLWVATSLGVGVWNGDTHRWKVLGIREGLCGLQTWRLELAADGSVWALSPVNGIARIDPIGLRGRCFPSFAGKDFTFQTRAPDGSIWATTRQRVVRFDGSSPAPAPVEVPLPDSLGQIWYLSFSPKGALWASGPKRLMRFDGTTWRIFAREDGLRGDVVSSLAALSENEVWVGYNDVAEVTHFSLDSVGNAHADQHGWDVSIVGRDAADRIWLDGTDGLKVSAPDGRLQAFSHLDGLIWDDVSPWGVREEADGSYMIATSRGLARYAPPRIHHKPDSLQVVISSVLLGGQERLGAVGLSVKPRDGTLVVQFAPLALNSADRIPCRYRLDGLEDDFEQTLLREVRYSGLAPGHYTLTVQCRSDASGWSRPGATFAFTVLALWWQTWWARLGAFALVLLAIWGIVRVRTGALNLRRIELEAAVAARNAELVQKNHELEVMSLTDPLTQVRNRRYFSETVVNDVAKVLRTYSGAHSPGKISACNEELVVLFVDIDLFKEVNDQHGHAAGDRMIQEVARRLGTVVRRSDVLLRWGGEEFMIISRTTPRANVPVLCARLLDAVGSVPFDLGEGIIVRKTCSLGWAPFPWLPCDPTALAFEDVIELADDGLYRAKSSGRNHSVGILPSTYARAHPEQVRIANRRNMAPTLLEIVKTGPGSLAESLVETRQLNSVSPDAH